MSAAASPARIPLFQEAQQYWEEFTKECKRRTESINALIANRGFASDERVQCAFGPQLRIEKPGVPSTEIDVNLEFPSWGPVINGKIKGREYPDVEFFSEELEIPIARDLDGAVVAVFDQGKSFSPCELAAYLTQSLRRCFPGVPLPC
jgi:hypothetical protein